MPKMKDSGVAWINTIPEEWELKKIKYTLQSRNENNNPIRSRDILSLTAKQGVIPFDEKEGGGNKPKEDYSAYKLAYPGDIVMNSMNVLSGSVGLSKYFGCVSPVYYMLRPASEDDDVRYFNYIFQTTVFQRSLLGLGNGILMKESDNGKLNTIRMRIPLDKLGNIYIPVPNSATQKKIADYLDSICPDIDVLLTDIQRQVETLEEYKKSVITEAVTKGLNPDVEMKDSGIEWIGKIPKEWMVGKIKAYVKKVGSGKTPKGDDNLYSEGEVLFLRSQNIYDTGLYLENPTVITDEIDNEMANTRVFYNDVLLNITGGSIGRCCLYNQHDRANVNQHVCIIRVKEDKICPSYMHYFWISNLGQTAIKLYQTGGNREGMSADAIKNTPIPIMPIKIQQEIADYLDVKCTEIDGAIEDKKKQLEILEEYKKSIIYEYVTGKKEVLA